MNYITIKYENKVEKYPIGTTYLAISLNSKFKNDVLGVKKNNQIFSLNELAMEDEEIEFITSNSIDGAKIYKAAIKFIFEVALKSLYNKSDIHYLHSVPGGMLAEIISTRDFTLEDITNIKKEVEKIIKEDNLFIHYNILKKEAKKFYSTTKCIEKASSLNACDNVVNIYKLKNYLNYFYTPILPYSTKYINKYDINYLGNNRLIILYPSNITNGLTPEYVHHENIIKAYYEGQDWLRKLKTPYLPNLNNLISASKIKGFIESCELHFNDEIKKACDDIIKNNEKRIIMIAGPSSSGKTTTTRVLGAYLRSKGYDPLCLSVDDYFLNRIDTPKDSDGNYDFECLEAIDLEKFNKDLVRLLKGEVISVPTYNFITGEKEYHNNTMELKENSIILIEGLHALNDKLTPSIPEKYKYKVYLSPFIPLNIDRHNYISTIDLRLIRRLIRDNRTRGHDVNETLNLWQSVRNGEEKYIFPFTHQANIIINTALPYEIGVLKVYAEPLLYSVDTASPFYEEARRLIKFLDGFYTISSEYVSKNSILREFIGGNNND